MRKLDDSELSDGDGDEDDRSFGSPSLSDTVKQPLFRKSKSQVRSIRSPHADTPQRGRCVLELGLFHKYPPSSPAGVRHDAVSGWKGLTPPIHPHPSHHVAQSGTGCRRIQCDPVPQPRMMTPRSPSPSHPSAPVLPRPTALGAHSPPTVLTEWLLSRDTARRTAERSASYSKQGHIPKRTWLQKPSRRPTSPFHNWCPKITPTRVVGVKIMKLK